jgi:hypothetical protein
MHPGENTIVELVDGRIYDSARESGSDPEPGNRRGVPRDADR